MTYIESKTRGDVYAHVKIITNDSIAVSPWMTQNSLKCAATRHKQKICNNRLLDKEESGTDKKEHQTSVLGIISTTTVNGGRPKGQTLTIKNNLQERMDEVKLHINHLFYSPSLNLSQEAHGV